MGTSLSDEKSLDCYLKKLCSDVTLQSQKEGFFNQWAGQLEPLWTRNFLVQFGKVKNDKERIAMVWDEEGVHTLDIQSFFTGKNKEVAEQKRQEGNKAYQQGENEKALFFYTQAVIRSPTTGEDLSLSLANRSAVLFHMKKYAVCLQDIKLSVMYNYPRRLRYKILDRRGDCCFNLKLYLEAKIAFCEALEALQEAEIEEAKTETLKASLKQKISKCEEIISDKKNKQQRNKAECSDLCLTKESIYKGVSEVLPKASSAVGLQCSGEEGRFIVANENIPTGKCLVRETPFGSVLMPEKRGTFCEDCFARLLAPVPCDMCSSVTYCSPDCRDRAQRSYHRWECPFLDLFKASGMSLNCALSFRIIAERGLDYFTKISSAINARVQVGDQDLNVPSASNPHHPDDYINFYNLVGLESQREVSDFLRRTLMAIFLLKVLLQAGFFGHTHIAVKKLSEDQLLIGALLLRHLQIIQFNAHEVSGIAFEGEKSFQKCKSVYLGLAVYPTVSFFNHSCFPAVGRYFYGKEMTIVNLRPIRAGEIIPENYGPIFTHHNLQERRRKLQSRYWFHCRCEACAGDWPLYATMKTEICLRPFTEAEYHGEGKSITARRNKKGKMKNRKNEEKEKNEEMATSPRVETEQEKMNKIIQAHKHYGKAISLMDQNKREEAIKMYAKWLDEASHKVLLPLKDVHLAVQALRLLVAARGWHFVINHHK